MGAISVIYSGAILEWPRRGVAFKSAHLVHITHEIQQKISNNVRNVEAKCYETLLNLARTEVN